ncbi:MAG: insulinase family protein, partial [Steroidobacteraceae bacterium]|nr:insulinase family protein [Steroidobacteraceae bacterium]
DAIVVSGQFLARDRALLVELLADALLRPHLDAQEFAKLRDRAIEQIRSAKDSNPAALLSVYGRALLFGQHPYGAPLAGSERSLASLAHEDVRDYYRNHFGADRLTLVFAGDLDPKWFRRMVARAFGAMPKANSSLVPLAAPQPLGARRVLLVDKPGAVQAYFWLANVGVPRAYPRRAALDLVNTLYGGRFTSILNTELRVKSGLTYGASSAFRRGLVAGEFAISSFTQTENLGKALDLALATLQRLHAAGIDAEQLESARQYVLGQYPLRLETASHWAAALGELDLYGLGTDDIDGYGPALAAVTVDDARAVIDAAFPRPETLCIVVIGDAARIRDELAKFGPVARAALSDPDFVIDQSAAR